MPSSLKYLFVFPLFYSAISYGQGRLILNNNPYVVIDNNAFVVVDNPATNAVTTMGTGGNIVTESEFDRLKWNIGTSTGIYIMPFTSVTNIKIPFTVNITAAGIGAGNLMFSTYNGPTWDNNTYRPSDVTHMFDYFTGSFNNSLNVIDRFWIIDANGYGTRPTATLGFTYIDAEHTPIGNLIVEADLGAQRFNNSLNIWGDYLPVGAINTVANTVTGVPATPANFFRSWTLSEITSPLSVELISFTGSCNKPQIEFNWSTATETNSYKFSIEGSIDGVNYTEVGNVLAATNSNTITNYQFSIYNQLYIYYRLVLENMDGSIETFDPIFLNCANSSGTVWAYTNPNGSEFVIQTSEIFNPNSTIYVTDLAGKIVATGKNISTETKIISIPTNEWSNGMYILNLIDGISKKEFKLILSR